MAVPTDEFTWATDTNHTDPPETWDGTVTKTAPSAGLQATGYLPSQRPAVNTWNWLFNVVGQWIAFLANRFETVTGEGELVYESVVSRTVIVDLQSSQEGKLSNTALSWSPSLVGGTPYHALLSQENSAVRIFPLNSYLRHGCVITDIEVIVQPGAARATTNRVQFDFYQVVHDFVTPAIGAATIVATDEDDGTTNTQVIGASSLTKSVVRGTTEYYVALRAGNTGGTNKDDIFGFRIKFNDPGPRNF